MHGSISGFKPGFKPGLVAAFSLGRCDNNKTKRLDGAVSSYSLLLSAIAFALPAIVRSASILRFARSASAFFF
jgi:hypothetical protein